MLQTRTGDPLLTRSRQEVPRDLQFISLPWPFSAKLLVFLKNAYPEKRSREMMSAVNRSSCMSFPGQRTGAPCSKNTVVFKRFIEYIAMT